MNVLPIVILVVTIIYLIIFQSSFWKYFFSFLLSYYVLTQIIFADYKTNTSKRKFYLTSWLHPFDSQIFLSLKVDVTKIKEFLKKYNEENNTDIHFTIFLIKVLGNIFQKFPTLNGNVLFGKFFQKKSVDISCLLSTDNGTNTEVLTVRDVDKSSLEEIREKVYEKKEIIDKNIDLNQNRKKFFLNLLPTFLLTYFLSVVSYFAQCGVSLTWFGLPKYFCGTAIICNYGKIGIKNTFLPIPRKIYF